MDKEGFAEAAPDVDSTLVKEVCEKLRKKAEGITIDPGADKSGKNFWKHLLRDEKLTTDSPYVKLALSPAVLNMAAQYFGEVPYLAYIQVTYSHPTDNASWKASQMWHQDYDDKKLFKLFVYCTDVKEAGDGPFTYLPKHLSNKIPNTFIPGRVEDDVMSKYVDLDKDVHVLMGDAESTFYIDTRSCYHLGSRIAEGHKRIAFMVGFVRYGSMNEFDNGIEITSELTDLEKLVLKK